jgi:hypothetical protein
MDSLLTLHKIEMIYLYTPVLLNTNDIKKAGHAVA